MQAHTFLVELQKGSQAVQGDMEHPPHLSSSSYLLLIEPIPWLWFCSAPQTQDTCWLGSTNVDLHKEQVEKNNNSTARTGDSAGKDPMVLVGQGRRLWPSPTSGGPWEAEELQRQQLLLDATSPDQRVPNSSHSKSGGKVKILIFQFSNVKFEDFSFKNSWNTLLTIVNIFWGGRSCLCCI